jgi:hypothetical protein
MGEVGLEVEWDPAGGCIHQSCTLSTSLHEDLQNPPKKHCEICTWKWNSKMQRWFMEGAYLLALPSCSSLPLSHGA